MASGPVIPVVLQRDNAIQTLRDIMGATNPAQAAAGTLRKEFGLDVEKNSIHGSDAVTTAAWEVSFFFNHLEFREPV
jgi:nucleoside-diphosphate kinase